MDNEIYDSAQLLGVYWSEDFQKPPENYWISNFFPGVAQFTEEEIDFTKISDIRKLAPLVVPTAQGVPIYSAAERLSSFAPAYIKIKDPIKATTVMRRRAGLGELGRNRPVLTPEQRYAKLVGDIVLQHRYATERRWEWLAAEAIIDARVILQDDRYPRTVVDFGRDSSHTIALTGAAQWGQAGVSILQSIQAMRQIVRTAKFGGVTNRITIGQNVVPIIQSDPEIREFLKTDWKSGTNINLKMGMLEGAEVEYLGNIENLNIFVYSDYYELPDGTAVPYMDPNDIVLTGPNIKGVKAFGAIQDIKAQFRADPVFVKMFDEDDPSQTNILTQSAPLMVPVNPNATLRATVLEP
jgi:hypothetical protein